MEREDNQKKNFNYRIEPSHDSSIDTCNIRYEIFIERD